MRNLFLKNFFDNSINFGFFDGSEEITIGDIVIVETKFGQDFAKVLNILSKDISVQNPLKVIRKASQQDILELRKNSERSRNSFEKVKFILKKHHPTMNVISCYFIKDKSKLLINYVCENKVDFRESVKELASTFKTRIEMRQISPREAARILGGMGICGQQCCCTLFNSFSKPITTSLMKEQKLLEHTAKTTGVCGKLVCCLAYEIDNYKNGKCIVCKSIPENSQIHSEETEISI